MNLTKKEQEILNAVQISGKYYPFEYDRHRIVIYTNVGHNDNHDELIFKKDEE